MHKLNKSKKRQASRTYLGLGLITAPAIVSGAVLSSAYVFAGNSAVDIVDLSLPISCGVSASGMDSHTAEVANGVYMPNIGTTTMKVTCNDNGGFSIYATGFTGNETGETNSNKLVGTAASGYATIDTGTATSAGDPDVSNWAMKLATDTSADFPITILDDYDYYHTVPDDFVKVATRLSRTDAGTEAVGSVLTSTYAAYISKTQLADTYTGQVKYTLVHPHDAPSPSTLYLQDTPKIIAAVPNEGDTATALDIRDGVEYTVGRLADGNIWLLNNLELNLTMTDASNKITADNTNASAESLNALFHGVSGGGSGGNLARAAVSSSWSDWSGSYTEPLINTDYNGRTVSDVTSTSGQIGGDWTIGSYYNYCAASAGNYCYDYDYSEYDAGEDICPKGWRMPTGGSSGEYAALYSEYNSDSDSFRTALQAPLSGEYSDGRGRDISKNGRFWSPTRYDNPTAYVLYIGGESDDVYTDYGDSRYHGYSVRCILTE